jgi:hypothetical protein
MEQHRVSEFYLRGFSRNSGPRILFEYDKVAGFAREIRPKKASAESKTAFAIEGSQPDRVENFFGTVESNAKPVFRRIRNQMALSAEDRTALSRFAALLVCSLDTAS